MLALISSYFADGRYKCSGAELNLDQNTQTTGAWPRLNVYLGLLGDGDIARDRTQRRKEHNK